MIQATTETSSKVPTKKEAMKKLKEKWIYHSFQSSSNENQFFGRAEKMTENYLEWRKKNKNKFIASEEDVSFEYNGVTLNGRIDWIEENPNGELEVIDFKSGKTAVSQNVANEDWQLNIYAWLIFHSPKFTKIPVKASLFFLEKQKMVSVTVDKKKVENLLDKEIKPLIDRILKYDFKADPESNKCRDCSYKETCPYRAP
jgi:DNA helicase-2/ATP-dependent DNA helicase PcrA